MSLKIKGSLQAKLTDPLSMLFHSTIFIFVFLPITFSLWLLATRTYGKQLPYWVLTIASFIFYGYFEWKFLLLLVGSMLFNYGLSEYIGWEQKIGRPSIAKALLVICIVGNIVNLAIFKYADFAINNMNTLFAMALPAPHILLPLAISFFTFQQIAYVVDVYRSPERAVSPLEYMFFTVFFPHLIAGPICYSTDIVPQMARQRTVDEIWLDAQAAVSIFVIGLFKKVVLVSKFQAIADVGFSSGATPDMATAWMSLLAYSLQIYFDFSAYSDMAIGLGLLFGIRLPLNFYSPYKASSVIEFWRCWHISLSRFLRDYLYVPLGGNRQGIYRPSLNLLLVMLIAGLWHGASWNFIFWGGLHGVFLVINHGFRSLGKSERAFNFQSTLFSLSACRLLTFTAVTIAWIPFRTANFYEAYGFFLALWSFGFSAFGTIAAGTALSLCIGLGICWFLPNSIQLLSFAKPTCTFPPDRLSFAQSLAKPLKLRFNAAWAVFLGILLFAVVRGSLDRGTDSFIYFQF